MGKLLEQLIHLSDIFQSHRVPTDPFKAGYHENTLYPSDSDKKGQTFIHGIGEVKLKKLKEIPVYDGTINGWNDYLEKYGKFCLFYSITGGDLNGWDCASDRQRQEFNAIILCGVDKYLEFVRLWKRFNDIQHQVLDKYDPFFTKNFFLKPSYTLGGCYYLPYYPNMDVIADDETLFKTFCFITEQEYNDTDAKIKKLWNVPTSELTDLDELYLSDFAKKRSIYMREKMDGFTECMRERIIELYGTEAQELYNELMNFPSKFKNNES